MPSIIVIFVLFLVCCVAGVTCLWFRYQKFSPLLYLLNFFSLSVILFLLFLSVNSTVLVQHVVASQLAHNILLYAFVFALVFACLKKFSKWFSYRLYEPIHQSTSVTSLVAFILLLTDPHGAGLTVLAVFAGYSLVSLWFGLLIFNYKTSNLFNPIKSVAYYGLVLLLAYTGAFLLHHLWSLPQPNTKWTPLILSLGIVLFVSNITIWIINYLKPFQDKNYVLFNLNNLPTDSFISWSKKSLWAVVCFCILIWWSTNGAFVRQVNHSVNKHNLLWANFIPLLLAIASSLVFSTFIIRYLNAKLLVLLCGLLTVITAILLLADNSTNVALFVYSCLRFIAYFSFGLLFTFALMWHYRQSSQTLFFVVITILCGLYAFDYYLPWIVGNDVIAWLITWATITIVLWQVFAGFFVFTSGALVAEYRNIMSMLLPNLRTIIEKYTQESNKFLETIIV